MRRSGFVGIAFGLESAVPRVLRTIGKVRAPDAAADPAFSEERDYLDRFRQSVTDAQQCGLDVSISVIGGLPGETADDFRTTLAFVQSLKVGVYAHNLLDVYPGTPLYARRRKFGLDAYREAGSAVWRTVHSYDAQAVRPLANSSTHRWRWKAAEGLADALCGRSGVIEADDDSVWAVVIYGGEPSPRISAFLRRVLTIGGFVIVLAESRHSAVMWRAFLVDSDIAFGFLGCLVADHSGRPGVFDSYGAVGVRQVRVVRAFRAESARVPVSVDSTGNSRFSVWTASARDARLCGDATCNRLFIGAGVQVADSCRVGNGFLRCEKPVVLYLDEDGTIRACWHGAPVGTVIREGSDNLPRRVPDTARVIVRGRSAKRSCHCPLGVPAKMTAEVCASLWDWDLASQLSWLFARARLSDDVVSVSSVERSKV
jgi:hypothetical protein